MKSSTAVALFAGLVPVVAAVVFVQIWTPGSESEPVERAAVSDSRTGNASKTSSSSTHESYSGTWYSASEPDAEPAESKAPSQPSQKDSADNETATLPTQTRDLPDASGRQTEAAAVMVTGDVGSLTFERQGATRADLPDIKASRVSVMGDDGEVLEFSSEHGQPVIVTSNLDDGMYKWEAVHQPDLSPRVREELSAAREAGDFRAERELKRDYRRQGLLPSEEEVQANIQTGTFRVQNGQMVNKDLPEE